MSGHSKWAGIKHQKALTDARRGQAFTKLANLIAVAARQGGGDPEANFQLRLAIQKAKAANMPNANIERSIKRGTGQLGGEQLEEIIYEGYGPGGVAIMIQVATDNRNRAASAVRSTLSRHGGRLGETGSVSFQFEQVGVITFKASDLEAASLAAIDAGAEDVDEGERELTIYTAANKLEQVRAKLATAGYEITVAELSYEPKQTARITDAQVAKSVMKLMAALEDIEDVADTFANFDISEGSEQLLS